MKKLLLFLILVLCFCSFSYAFDQTKLAHYYRLNETSGNAIDYGENLIDLSEFGTVQSHAPGHIETGNRGPYTTGINFIKTGSGENWDLSFPFAIGFWINNTAFGDFDHIFVLGRSVAPNFVGCRILGDAGTSLDVRCGIGGGEDVLTTGITFPVNTFTHIVFVFNVTHMIIYENGTKGNSILYTKGSAAAQGEMYLGVDTGASQATPVNLEQMFVYNGTFLQADVDDVYNGGPGIDLREIGVSAVSFVDPTPADGTTNNTISGVFINTTCTSDNITVNWNGTILGNGANSPFLFELNSSLVPQEGTYSYNASCQDSVTATRTWIYDATQPTITLNPTNFHTSSNLSTVNMYADSVLANITISDNIELQAFQINITYAGALLFNFTNSSLSGTTYNYLSTISTATWPKDVFVDVEYQSSDSHTNANIGDYKPKKVTNAIEFDTQEGNKIKIQSVDDADIEAIKEIDRYSIDIDFTDDSEKKREFYIMSDHKIIYKEDSEYKAHFVILSDGVNGNWLDFEGTDSDYTVEFLDDYTVLISFDKMKDVKFKSIGGLNLNVLNFVWYFGEANLSEIGALMEQPANIILNLTRNISAISNINVTLNYNGTFFNSAAKSVSDGAISFNQLVTIPTLTSDQEILYTWNVTVTQNDSSEINFSLSANHSVFFLGLDNCTNFTNKVLTTSYFDQLNDNPITVENGYNLLFDGLIDFEINGTFDGRLNDSFCVNLNDSSLLVDFNVTGEFTLKKATYATSIYNFDPGNELLASNSPTENVSFFMIQLNESTTIKFIWLTEAFQPITGTMEIYECLGDGTRVLVQSTPIIDSVAFANLVLLNKRYSYEIIVNGQRFSDFEDFSKCHIEGEATVSFNVDTSQTDLGGGIGLSSIVCNVRKTGNNTVEINWTTNPGNSNAILGCMFADRLAVGGYTNFFVACTNTSFNIERTIPSSGFTYQVYGKLFQNGFSMECDQVVEFNTSSNANDAFGIIGILSIALFIIAVVLFFNQEGELQIVGCGIAVLASWFLGMFAFGWVTVSAILTLLIVVVAIGRYSRSP